MAKSTALITDITSVITNGPAGTTPAKSIAAAGPIMDYPGNCSLILTYFQETAFLLGKVAGVTDAGDTANLALINGVIALLNGTSSPSTQALTDMTTLFTSVLPGGTPQPGAATIANCIAAAGPIMDYVGNISISRKNLEGASVLLTYIRTDTDSSGDSTNSALIAKLLNALNNTVLT